MCFGLCRHVEKDLYNLAAFNKHVSGGSIPVVFRASEMLNQRRIERRYRKDPAPALPAILPLSIGVPVVLTRNDFTRRIANGQRGTIVAIYEERKVVRIKLAGLVICVLAGTV